MYLTMQKIAILEGDVWGHRQDICEHKVISQGVFDEIEALTQKKVSPEQISHVVSSKYRLSPSFVEFVMEKKITA